jgi:hypothetical protein
VERGIELYAEGATRQGLSTLNLAEALRSFSGLKKPDYYLAIISFVGANHQAARRRVREQLASRLEMPVLLTAGPRYLHYFEQIYKGGPARGMFLILTIEAIEDVPIPGAGYTFGQLQNGSRYG